MIRKVNANVLFVQNLEQCISFYRDTLGVEVVFRDATSCALRMQGQDFALVTVASGVQMLNEEVLAVPDGAGRRSMLCADVDDVDAAYEALTAKGVTFIRPPVDQYWGWRAAYFADPEGNIWEFRQPVRDQSK